MQAQVLDAHPGELAAEPWRILRARQAGKKALRMALDSI